ncbi:unnamed protein product [Brachionus calyciflorus]|uniref:Ancient ubiquitous protein 1 n=1 Tax=Brachionus calyciflorus TaxID=104777 RepID=A0A813UA60_9BILA|nr:unnamed protein product [Brachionus calyciflorus]
MDDNSKNPNLEFKNVSKFYDQSFILTNSNKIISYFLFLIYFPFGLALLIIRFVLLLFLYLLSSVIPGLKSNSQFILLVSFVLGLYTKTNSLPSVKDLVNSKQIYVCNHITCFDYISIKSVINKIFLIETDDYLNSEEFFLSKILKNFINSKKLDSYSGQILYFPELLSTNGRNELLKFNFDLIKDSKMDIKPICLKFTRPFLFSTQFGINLIESNQLINLILFLFSPVTVCKIDFSIEKQIRKDDENIEELAERIRNLIASKLGVKISDFNSEQLKQVWTQSPRKSEIAEKNHSVGVSDVCKLAMQIKDILPDVSFETIKYHINSSSTLDIDTVLASILDADSQESSLLRSQSSPVTVTSSPKPVISSSKASVFESKKPNKYKTYEERKFDLINEARKRYLSRENNKIEKAKA